MVNVVGAGLAGSEAAWQIAQAGVLSVYMKCVQSNRLRRITQVILLN